MADKIVSPFLLSSEDDFSILLEALDSHYRELSALSYSQEVVSASMDLTQKIVDGEEANFKDFSKTISKRLESPKVKDNASKLRDKIIMMKAKVVLTKEYLRGSNLDRQIDDLLRDVS